MRKSVLAIPLLSLWAAFAAAAPNVVNEVHSYKMTIQPNAPLATITLRVTGTSMQVPLKWSVVVNDLSGNVLFQVQHDDTWLDKFFGEKGYVEGCKGYEECKHKWYFEDLPKAVAKSFDFVKSHPATRFEHWQIDSLNTEAGEFLRSKGLSEAKRTAVIAEMERFMTNGEYAEFGLPDSPVQQGSEFMYVPSLRYFVPFWHD